MVILDASHPREKPCGGGLTGRALAFLDRAGIRARVPGVAVNTLRFSSGPIHGPVEALMPLDGDLGQPLLVVSRRVLDGALLEAAVAAGAEWRPERVTDVSVHPGGVSLQTAQGAVEAGLVLGADGANSLVRRRLHRPLSRSQMSIATGFYAHGVSSREVTVHCVASPPGYIWSFPRPDHAAVGICAQADVTTASRLHGIVSEWTERSSPHAGGRLERYSWPIPSLCHADFRKERPAGPRWMLLGDAAGLVDPLTREGIFYALESADLAAEAVSGSRDPASRYAQRMRDEVYPELARAAALKAGFFTSHFTDLLVDGLCRSAKIQRIMTDLVAGQQPYATLKRRLVMTFEVGLAWRLLKLQARGMVG